MGRTRNLGKLELVTYLFVSLQTLPGDQFLNFVEYFIWNILLFLCKFVNCWSFAVKETAWLTVKDTTKCTTWSNFCQCKRVSQFTEASHQKVEASRSTFSKASQKGRSFALMFWWHPGSNLAHFSADFWHIFTAKLFSADFWHILRPNFSRPFFATFFGQTFLGQTLWNFYCQFSFGNWDICPDLSHMFLC